MFHTKRKRAHFKHPTIRDAFAAVVASNPPLMDIYLTGAPLDKLFTEVSCGNVGLRGVSVVVPATQYDIVIDKIRQLDTDKWFNRLSLYRFLTYRCDRNFLRKFLIEFPEFVSKLRITPYLYTCSDIGVLVCLHKYGLLTEEVRSAAAAKIRDLAIRIPDPGFLRNDVRSLLLDSEYSEIIDSIKSELLPSLNDLVNDWRADYSGEDDPESYFDELKSAIIDYRGEFEECEESQVFIEEALDDIEQAINDLASEYRPSLEDKFWGRDQASSTSCISSRSVFDDVDE